MNGDRRKRGRLRRGATAALVTGMLMTSACDGHEEIVRTARQLTGGDPSRAPRAIRKYGCGSCHNIPGIAGARGLVGPPLDRFGLRTYVAGRLTNDAAHLTSWIEHPRNVDPKTAMPDMGVTPQDARDIAAYLYTLR